MNTYALKGTSVGIRNGEAAVWCHRQNVGGVVGIILNSYRYKAQLDVVWLRVRSFTTDCGTERLLAGLVYCLDEMFAMLGGNRTLPTRQPRRKLFPRAIVGIWCYAEFSARWNGFPSFWIPWTHLMGILGMSAWRKRCAGCSVGEGSKVQVKCWVQPSG